MRTAMIGAVCLVGCLLPLLAACDTSKVSSGGVPDSSDNNLESTDPERIESLSEIYLNGDPAGAIEGLKEYVADHPADDLAWVIMGNAYTDLDQYEEAKDAFNNALKQDPKQFRAVTGLGILHRKAGNLDAAMAAYQRAVQMDPDYAQAYSSMTVIALKQYNDQDAVRYAEKGYALDKTDPGVAANLAVAYHFVGDYEKRDKFTRIAEDLNYDKVDALQKIYSGELILRDEQPADESGPESGDESPAREN